IPLTAKIRCDVVLGGVWCGDITQPLPVATRPQCKRQLCSRGVLWGTFVGVRLRNGARASLPSLCKRYRPSALFFSGDRDRRCVVRGWPLQLRQFSDVYFQRCTDWHWTICDPCTYCPMVGSFTPYWWDARVCRSLLVWLVLAPSTVCHLLWRAHARDE